MDNGVTNDGVCMCIVYSCWYLSCRHLSTYCHNWALENVINGVFMFYEVDLTRGIKKFQSNYLYFWGIFPNNSFKKWISILLILPKKILFYYFKIQIFIKNIGDLHEKNILRDKFTPENINTPYDIIVRFLGTILK